MHPTLKLALKAILLQIVVLLVVAGICWAGCWTTRSQYSSALFGAGVLIVLAALVGGLGQSISSADFGYQYGRTATDQTAIERLAQDKDDRITGHRGRMVFLGLGIVTVALSIVMTFV